MKRILILVVALGLIGPGMARGARQFAKVGTIGGQFLKIGIGARAVAMGSAFVSVADDATAVYWNPAGIARIQKSVLSINHTTWLADISLRTGHLPVPHPVSPRDDRRQRPQPLHGLAAGPHGLSPRGRGQVLRCGGHGAWASPTAAR